MYFILQITFPFSCQPLTLQMEENFPQNPGKIDHIKLLLQPMGPNKEKRNEQQLKGQANPPRQDNPSQSQQHALSTVLPQPHSSSSNSFLCCDKVCTNFAPVQCPPPSYHSHHSHHQGVFLCPGCHHQRLVPAVQSQSHISQVHHLQVPGGHGGQISRPHDLHQPVIGGQSPQVRQDHLGNIYILSSSPVHHIHSSPEGGVSSKHKLPVPQGSKAAVSLCSNCQSHVKQQQLVAKQLNLPTLGENVSTSIW